MQWSVLVFSGDWGHTPWHNLTVYETVGVSVLYEPQDGGVHQKRGLINYHLLCDRDLISSAVLRYNIMAYSTCLL